MESNAGKTWRIQNPDRSVIEEISRSLGVSRITARILANRNLCNIDEIGPFLNPEFSTLSNPMEMADIEKAARRIITACEKDEKIFLYADYDVDGASGSACLYLFLKELFPDMHLYIHQNDRSKDGYGLKMEHIKYAAKSGYSLIITVDCGISNFEEVRKADELGVDVIITDHHTVRDKIPVALAVLNPKREDCNYRFKGLAGVGVVFALICAIRKILRDEGFFLGRTELHLTKFLDLVALGTVADLAPLKGDNRIFVKAGLGQIKRNPRPGIQALIEVSGIKQGYVDEVDLAYRIGPRLNAAGRIGDSLLSSAILVETSATRALDLARILSRENRKRQIEEERIFHDALRLIEEKDLEKKRVIVAGSENWHIGIIGIVASKLVTSYSKPAIVFTFEGSEAKGSGRSKSPFDILKILSKCSPYIERFGGHPHAAGIMINRDHFEEFGDAIQDAAFQLYEEESIVPEINIDAEVGLIDISDRVLEELETLGPFGIGNPEPVFLSRNLRVFGFSLKNRGMVTFNVAQKDAHLEVILFNRGELQSDTLDRIDLLYTPKFSMRGRRREIKLFARDLKLL